MSGAAELSSEEREWLSNPVWYALQTEHRWLRTGEGPAARYPVGYIPFAGLATRDEAAFEGLRGLLSAGESVYITGDQPLLRAPAGLEVLEEIAGLQMVFGSKAERWPGLADSEVAVERLTAGDVPAMLALKEAAFPGFYGPRAPELGTYYGIRVEGQLIAMAGERLALPGMREVSAVCTHPSHTGKGYAARLVARLADEHSQAGMASFLHLVADNRRALELYERLGFVQSRALLFQHLRRAP